jgi:propionyl-CoA synthetase
MSFGRVPKTRPGNLSRGMMAKIADGKSWTMPATIGDPIILDEIATALKSIGYAAEQKT